MPNIKRSCRELAATPVPVAQYLRMSTEDQQCSIENQREKILAYAIRHNFAITHTYEDAGKSGVVVKYRRGLKGLLQDVIGGKADYKAILVYDVSRWGRFQNPDEAAHYEFLCESAGIPIHYCAEQFENDGTMPSSLMKALKRTMAAEYSRELSVKVYDGQKRFAQMGYHIGGTGLYGLKRMAVSLTGQKRYLLLRGERKHVTTHHIVLVPGKKSEVRWIRFIFRAAAYEAKTCAQIAKELTRRKARFLPGHKWNHEVVWRILRNPQYAGYSVWNRTTQKMHARKISNPPSRWIVKANAFTPIVDDRTFKFAQKMLDKRRTVMQSDNVVLAKVKKLLANKGELSHSIIKKARGLFRPGQYYIRYGSYFKLYELVGYKPPPLRVKSQRRAKAIRVVRNSLLEKVQQLFPEHVKIIRPSRSGRKVLEVDSRFLVSVYICRQFLRTSGMRRWMLKAVPHERQNIAMICPVDLDSEEIGGYYIRPPIGNSLRKQRYLHEDDPWLRAGRKLKDLGEFYGTTMSLVAECRHPPKS